MLHLKCIGGEYVAIYLLARLESGIVSRFGQFDKAILYHNCASYPFVRSFAGVGCIRNSYG